MPARAQDNSSINAQPGCELHVWPGSDLVYLYFGWAHGGTVNGAVKGREGYPKPPANPLSLETQAAQLGQTDLQSLLKLPGYAIIVHPEALPSRTIRSSTSRIVSSNSPCYAELMIDDLLLSQNVIGGNALRGSFRFRDFGPDTSPRRTFGAFSITPLKLFPPKTPEGEDAAAAELKLAFTSNLKQFAAALLKPVKARH